MIRISKEQYTYFFDPAISPVAFAKEGDEVIFETKDCFNDEIEKPEDLITKINVSHVNPCTGPLFIENTEPGDIIAIKIEDISLRDWGVMCLSPGSGVLGEFSLDPLTKILKINQKKGYIDFAPGIQLELRPHVGTMATTPLMKFPTGRTGYHGGNMDIRALGAKSTVYFPVFVPGALLCMGDVHANMGDGEICIGIETAANVTVKIEKIYKKIHLTAPMIETNTHWITYADAPNGKLGIWKVCTRMVEFLMRKTNITVEEANLLISATGDVHFGQWAEAGYNYTFYLKLPKSVFRSNTLSNFD